MALFTLDQNYPGDIVNPEFGPKILSQLYIIFTAAFILLMTSVFEDIEWVFCYVILTLQIRSKAGSHSVEITN